MTSFNLSVVRVLEKYSKGQFGLGLNFTSPQFNVESKQNWDKCSHRKENKQTRTSKLFWNFIMLWSLKYKSNTLLQIPTYCMNLNFEAWYSLLIHSQYGCQSWNVWVWISVWPWEATYPVCATNGIRTITVQPSHCLY